MQQAATETNAQQSAIDDFARVFAQAPIGIVLVDEELRVTRRTGPLSDWAPPEGEALCASPLLVAMEDSLRRLQREGGEIVLPSMRAPTPDAPRVTISILWNDASRQFLVVTMPDHGANQMDRLLVSERREKQLLQQQAAAAQAQARVASSLYRDIVESSGDLVLRFGADLAVVFANERAARFLGTAPERLRGRKIAELFPALTAQTPWRLDMCAAQPASFELAASDATGARTWLWWDVRWIPSDEGGEFQAVGRDVTQARRLRAETDKANEEARAAAVASERLRIAQDLHDTLVHSIVNVIAQTRLIVRAAPEGPTQDAARELEQSAREGLNAARAALTQMRAAQPDDDPRRIVKDFAQQPRAEPVAVDAQINVEMSALPPQTAETLCRILREALRNIALHSGARNVKIDLQRAGDHVVLVVADDGVGFDPAAQASGHYGLVGMRERAERIGAALAIASAPNGGTRVTLIAPAREAAGPR